MAYTYSREQALSNQALNPTKTIQPVQKKEEPKEQVANIFGYGQGTKENPITKTSQPVQTSQQRAEATATNIQVRQSLPSTTAAMPKNVNLSIKQGDSNNNKNSLQPNLSNTGSYNNSTMAKEEIKKQQNIENLLAREKRLGELKQQTFLNLGLVKTPQQEKVSFLNPKETLIGLGKEAGQFPFNLASLPLEVGGRVGFAIESATYPKGREELFRAGKETPKLFISSVNPTTTQGLFNIGMIAFAVKGTAKGIRQAREPVKFSAEESGTLRVSGEESVRDITNIKVEAYQGKSPIKITGKGIKEFFPKSETESLTIGTGEIGKIKFETRGTATKIEPQYKGDLGGYNSIDIIKTSKGKYYLDTTQSATLIEKPFMSMKTLSRTLELPKNKPIIEGKPMSISVGTTGEIFIRDIFNPQKNILKKVVVSESGKVKTETYLGTSRFSVSAKTFEQQFKTARTTTPQEFNFNVNKAEFVKEFKPETMSAGSTVLKQQFEIKGLPTQGDLLLKVARQEAVSQSFRLKTAQVSKSASAALGLVSGTSLIQKTETTQTAKPFIIFKPMQEILIGQTITKPIQLTKPISSISSAIYQRPISRPFTVPTTIPQTITKPIQLTKPIQQTITRPLLIQEPPIRPMFDISPTKPATFYPPFFLPPPIGLDLNLGRGAPSSKIKTPKYGYMPSIEAGIFNIRGKKTKGWQSGLTLRPL